MIDLISILVLFYNVDGLEMESELQLPAAQCQAAERAISSAIAGEGGPTVELWNGAKVPVQRSSCMHACVTEDGLPDLDVMAALEPEQNPQGMPVIRLN